MVFFESPIFLYDDEGHKNTEFLDAKGIGPYPRELRRAWTMIREEAIANYGIEGEEGSDEWNTLGPLAESTLASARKDERHKEKVGGGWRPL